jgi:hypothetical protein
MELADLNEDERVALVALLDEVIAADAEVTEDEPPKLVQVIEELTEDAYRLALDEADHLVADGVELRDMLGRVRRQEARELIFGTAMEVAIANAVLPPEGSILEWLAAAWNITVRS